ncbi:hypothetical protein A2274_03490 [candidate division WWE3 bacterium RIFOXYA12_FULL_43_11]|uniref:Uncharacterized protein n=1 Tax=candidate division WWE3 bacterium TaxID=2053526 RepID=A0A3D0ZQ53_UNCKA|nr:MAG: hypothetical protein A2245_02045 [candidate division WWE3 bacterium RIFOXYA2_FULL_43_12]OGC64826.1 MAG: hypothetical protein A2274_03490 [candidate division WWE3 bacterium RIFOXYA12_FULL_43_11]HCC41853.1 hypothetical protein [candidate division WWE3 bacterium]
MEKVTRTEAKYFDSDVYKREMNKLYDLIIDLYIVSRLPEKTPLYFNEYGPIYEKSGNLPTI